MCLHIAVAKRAEEIASEYGREIKKNFSGKKIAAGLYRVSAFTRPVCCVVTADRAIRAFEWGLIPYWIKNRKSAGDIGRLTYNARGESIFEKPAFREAVRTKRCVVPVTGFFEWRHEKNDTIPYYIFPRHASMFSLGAVWDDWADPVSGYRISAFSIVTTPANPRMEYIHNTKKRMPLILSRQEKERWLDPDLSLHDVTALIKPFDEKRMDACEIGKDFLKKSPEDKTLLEKCCRMPGLF